MVIQHNLTGMNSNRQLNIMTNLQAKSSEKLSSGYKINRAADDAAGLAISEKMRRQIRGLSQATENVQDGVSYCQVADSALAEIDEMLARMNQLCIQAATDTLTVEDRQAIDMEIQKIKEECNRVFHTTKFNEKPIWDEQTTDRKIVGHEDRAVFTWKNNNGDSYTMSVNDTNKGAMPTNGFKIKVNSEKTALNVTWTGYDGVSYTTKDIPIPSEDELHESGMNVDFKSYMDYEKYPKAVGIEPDISLSVDIEADRDKFISYIDNKTISCYDDLSISGTVYGTGIGDMYINGGVISSYDTVPYYAGLTTRDSISGSDNDHIYPTVGGTANNDNLTKTTTGLKLQFGVNKNANTKPDPDVDLTATAVNTVNALTGQATVYTRARKYDDEATRGIWWSKSTTGYYSESAQSFTADDLDTAIANALSEKDGVTNSVIKNGPVDGELIIPFTLTADSAIHYTGKDAAGNDKNGADTTALGTFYLHVKIKNVSGNENAASVISRINNITGIDLQTNGLSSKTVYNSVSSTFEAPIWGGTMRLNIQAGADNTQGDLIPLEYDVLNNATLGLQTFNTQTAANAKSGLSMVKKAAQKVDEQRGVFGAYQNRMEHTVKSLGNTVENTTSAEFLIRDTDMAAEMVKFSNQKILSQAGQSMLAQANQTNQGVMALLQ